MIFKEDDSTTDKFILFMEENGYISCKKSEILMVHNEYYDEDDDESNRWKMSPDKHYRCFFEKLYADKFSLTANKTKLVKISFLGPNISTVLVLQEGESFDSGYISCLYGRRWKDIRKDIKIVEKLIPIFINITHIENIVYMTKNYYPYLAMTDLKKEISVISETREAYTDRNITDDIVYRFRFDIDEDNLENAKFWINNVRYSLFDLSKFYEDYLPAITY